MKSSLSLISGLRIRLIAIIFFALLPGFVLLLIFSSIEQNRARQDNDDEALALARLLSSTLYKVELRTVFQREDYSA